ncbi:hypothetical protein chiPu_0009688 [Chiloscyllium punctatum]|uniref:Uncharacterized protein n=1 Tax=Chiloscyllium punctatum TaxID=137246 RepID=A0A401SLI0_CHIPU|nr:hypothetical protein [Chiloscyllium punctatum]
MATGRVGGGVLEMMDRQTRPIDSGGMGDVAGVKNNGRAALTNGGANRLQPMGRQNCGEAGVIHDRRTLLANHMGNSSC